MFQYELSKVRADFEFCSNRLRGDFEELQRMESELQAASMFSQTELAHWKSNYDSGHNQQQTKIYLIEVTR